MSTRRNTGLGIYTGIFYLYLYLPILILVVFSFNAQRLNLSWEGFTFHWYEVLFSDAEVANATRNTLTVAILSTIVSTVIGTLAALALHRYTFRLHAFSETSLYIPIVIPEIVMGIGLLSLYALFKIGLGLTTITLSHIAFSIPFVALVVRARLHGFDRSVEEAAMDLGANEFVTFWRVTLPLILPGRPVRRDAGLHPVAGRFHHHFLHRRARIDHPAAPGLRHGQDPHHPRDQRPFDDLGPDRFHSVVVVAASSATLGGGRRCGGRMIGRPQTKEETCSVEP